MRININLRELQTFIAIADYGTFVAAGEAIGLTQSAVSLQIKSLETKLDTALFDRSKRPPIINAQGLKLVKRGRDIIQQCEALQAHIKAQTLGGVLRIGVIPTVMSGMLPQTLLKLRQSHPQLEIELISGLSAQLVELVNTSMLDAAIIAEPTQLGSGLSWHAFAEEPLVVIAPQTAKGVLDYEVLTRYPFIQFMPDTYTGQLIQSLLQDRGIQVSSHMNLDSLEAIAKMVTHGLGVSIVPQRIVDQPFPKGVKILPFGNKAINRVLGVVERVTNSKTEFIRALVQVLIGQSRS